MKRESIKKHKAKNWKICFQVNIKHYSNKKVKH